MKRKLLMPLLGMFLASGTAWVQNASNIFLRNGGGAYIIKNGNTTHKISKR